ncbi:MAG: aminodeoxychorismate/anthranilate synthase component II [Planctomycetota bacterium]
MILLIDNYDSFAHNLARYLRRLGQEVTIKRNDAVDVPAIRALAPQAIVLSPGPCTPNEAGCSLEAVRELHTTTPLLGICLGHQTIAAALGASVVRAKAPMHGRTSLINHDGTGLFEGLPNRLTVCRYHSLVVDRTSLPEDLMANATCDDGTIMALQHRRFPVFGLQFHPEAILTEHGYGMLAKFLTLADSPIRDDSPSNLAGSELRSQPQPKPYLPSRPVTF